MDRIRRAIGTVVGSAVGDALGAPFEFGPADQYSDRFPGDGEMCGGQGWDPGEATDATQMALHVAQSLLDHDGLDLADIFARFQRWAAAGPKDIGIQTQTVLANGEPWDRAATVHFEQNMHGIADTLSEVESAQRERHTVARDWHPDRTTDPRARPTTRR